MVHVKGRTANTVDSAGWMAFAATAQNRPFWHKRGQKHVHKWCGYVPVTLYLQKQAHSSPRPVLNPECYTEYGVRTWVLRLSLFVSPSLHWKVPSMEVDFRAKSSTADGPTQHRLFSQSCPPTRRSPKRKDNLWVSGPCLVLNKGTLQPLSGVIGRFLMASCRPPGPVLTSSPWSRLWSPSPAALGGHLVKV